MTTCPRCITGVMPDYAPAISRTDNKTRICSACGMLEAIEDMIHVLTPQSEWGITVNQREGV